MSANHSLPIPPAGRSPKGPGEAGRKLLDDESAAQASGPSGEQGRQDNIRQNTTNQGYQQDR